MVTRDTSFIGPVNINGQEGDSLRIGNGITVDVAQSSGRIAISNVYLIEGEVKV